jgi:glycolate oxidase iron-sulfur subunit
VEGVDRCVHCGLCLAYCPTFSLLGTEMDSPRGRIHLIKSLAEGRIRLTDSAAAHLDLCLGCRACETVCPSGVPYGELIEAARAEIERQRPGGPLRRLFRWLNFAVLLPHPRLLSLAAGAFRFYQTSGLRAVVRRSGLLGLLPDRLRQWEPLLPDLPPARAPLPEVTPATLPVRGRVGLLSGCIQRVAFGPHNRATVRVLARNGFEVVVPRSQACCGALHAHSGEHGLAQGLARQLIEVFEAARVDRVVVNVSGCGAHMKAYATLLADDPAWRERARRFAASVRDVSELLATEPLRGPLRPVARTVTYHDPCHIVHGQKIRQEPRILLGQVPGLELVELPESDWCCGSAGTYNLVQPEMAQRLQQRKIAHIRETGAAAVVTANPGCIIQIAQGLRARRLPPRPSRSPGSRPPAPTRPLPPPLAPRPPSREEWATRPASSPAGPSLFLPSNG